MRNKIGLTAGAVWNLLREKGEMNMSGLPKALNEKSPIVHQALGWLAREGKIHFRNEGKSVFVSLVESEKGK